MWGSEGAGQEGKCSRETPRLHPTTHSFVLLSAIHLSVFLSTCLAAYMIQFFCSPKAGIRLMSQCWRSGNELDQAFLLHWVHNLVFCMTHSEERTAHTEVRKQGGLFRIHSTYWKARSISSITLAYLFISLCALFCEQCPHSSGEICRINLNWGVQNNYTPCSTASLLLRYPSKNIVSWPAGKGPRPRPSQPGSDSLFARGVVGEWKECLPGSLEPGRPVSWSKSLALSGLGS